MVFMHKSFGTKWKISYLIPQQPNWIKGQQYSGNFGNMMVNKVWLWIVAQAMHLKKFQQNSFQLYKHSHMYPAIRSTTTSDDLHWYSTSPPTAFSVSNKHSFPEDAIEKEHRSFCNSSHTTSAAIEELIHSRVYI